MNICHLHLHVRDRDVSEHFYAQWLHLRVQRREAELTFMSDLALMEDPSPARLPAWFHFGCKLASGAEVESLCSAMSAAGLTIRKSLYRDESFSSFRVEDPDGYAIELDWEAPP